MNDELQPGAVEQALKDLALRALEYVEIEERPGMEGMECDAEVRKLAKDGLLLLGIDPAPALTRYLREKKLAHRRGKSR